MACNVIVDASAANVLPCVLVFMSSDVVIALLCVRTGGSGPRWLKRDAGRRRKNCLSGD